jgi:hypothetical protein
MIGRESLQLVLDALKGYGNPRQAIEIVEAELAKLDSVVVETPSVTLSGFFANARNF